MRKSVVLLLLWVLTSALMAQETRRIRQIGTRPSADNDRTLREISEEEIPPNLNFYAMDPLYDPNAVLGWAEERIEEKLNRGLVVLPRGENRVYLSWRLLREDPTDGGFHVYRAAPGQHPVRLTSQTVTATTDYVDASAVLTPGTTWFVKPVVAGRERAPSQRVRVETQPYRTLRLKEDVPSAAMVGVGDLDGDGIYDFVVKHPTRGGKDPGRMRPNRNTYKYDGYNGKTGEFLWRIDLGWNVDMGIWWTPMIVRDLDGDNKAEVCVRTSDYAATRADSYAREGEGVVWGAPEYLAVYNGQTGQLIDKAPWIELGKVQDWGDNTGNRASRHMLAVAYLDGKTPAVLAVRGTTFEGSVHQVADILGDWREELVTVVQGELRIYSTTIPARDRRVCLMQDPLYRNDVCHHTMGYTNRHYPMTSTYLGAGE